MSLLCLLVGHKWQFKRRHEQVHKGETWVTVTHFSCPNCQRCGKENPAWMGDTRIAAVKALEKAGKP